MNIKFDDLVKVFAEKLENRGVSSADAVLAGEILAQNSADGVYSHGVNRFPRVVSYIDKGYISVFEILRKTDMSPELIKAYKKVIS